MGIFITSTFSKSNADTDALFLSYREAVEKFASESGDSLRDVARYLKREQAYRQHAIWLNGPERTSVWDEHGTYIGCLLDYTIINNEVGTTWTDDGVQVDPDIHGWWRKEFLFYLTVEYGMLTPPSLDAPNIPTAVRPFEGTADEALVKRLERTDQDLANARSHVEALKIQLSEAQRSIDNLRRLVGDETCIARHNTHLMKVALDIQRQFWKTTDRSNGKQEAIIDYLIKEHDLSKVEAAAVERVACPIDRKR